MENMTLKLINNNQSESSSDSLISSKTSNKSQSQIINNLNTDSKIDTENNNITSNSKKSINNEKNTKNTQIFSITNNNNNLNTSFNYYNNNLQLNFAEFMQKKKNLMQTMKIIFKRILSNNSINQNFTSISEHLKQLKDKFFDNQFPPNENSLIKGFKLSSFKNNLKLYLKFKQPLTLLHKNWRNLKWKRESETLKFTKIFDETIESKEIKIGDFSNKNFISVISALSEFPNLIKKLFIFDKKNENAYFCVKLCKDGLYKEIIIDDFFPFKNQTELAFTSDYKNVLWPQILEKAYAKAYGSYNNIDKKQVESILRDLTFAPVIILDNSNDELIDVLLNAKNEKWLILASAGDTEASQDLLKELGLEANYEYTILNVYKLEDEDLNKNTLLNNASNYDDNYRVILKIRNLWSKIEWMGDWSDISTYWNTDFRIMLDYQPDDQSFYMNLKDFKHYFSKIKICKHMDDYYYKSIQIYQKPENFSLVKITINKTYEIEEENNIYCNISLVQEDNKNWHTNEYLFGISRLILCKMIDENNIEYIEGKMGLEREIILEKKIYSPGNYLIFCELTKINKETPYVISVYSSEEINLIQEKNENFPQILEKIYISCAKIQNNVATFDVEGAPKCSKYSGSTQEGYSYIYVENLEDDASLIEDVKYTKFEGLKLLPPFFGTSYHIEIGPNESQLILIQHLELNEYNLIFSYQSSIQFGKKTLIKLAKEQGIKKKRKDKKTNVDLDIDVYIYKHMFGLCYYYENHTENKRLKEKINIINNSNVEFSGEKEGTNEVKISVEPHQTAFIQLKGKNNLWKVQPIITYAIENVDEKKNVLTE